MYRYSIPESYGTYALRVLVQYAPYIITFVLYWYVQYEGIQYEYVWPIRRGVCALPIK